MKSNLSALLLVCLLAGPGASAQVPYAQHVKKYQQDYVSHHEVVEKADRKYFRFFPASSQYKVEGKFTRLRDTIGFLMPTSGKTPAKYFRYGTIHFELKGKKLKLTVFRSQQLMNDPTYKNHLFLPFTDLTSGDKSYGGGRYIGLEIGDIKNNKVVFDFNKAYNPYCAYSAGFNCPIPPRENDLPVSVEAGEKAFAKPVH